MQRAAFRRAFLLFLKHSPSHQAPGWHAAPPREGKASLDGAAVRGLACGTSKPSSGDTAGRGAQPLHGTNTRTQPWLNPLQPRGYRAQRDPGTRPGADLGQEHPPCACSGAQNSSRSPRPLGWCLCSPSQGGHSWIHVLPDNGQGSTRSYVSSGFPRQLGADTPCRSCLGSCFE